MHHRLHRFRCFPPNSTQHPSFMSPTLMLLHLVASLLLATVLSPLTGALASSSSSSLSSFTGDLAPSLLPFTLVMLVAAGGTGFTSAANYSARQLQAMMVPGARGPASDFFDLSAPRNGPSPRHLNAEMLTARMGADFNADWMSVERPTAGARGGPANVPPTDVDEELVEDLREMGFSYTDEHGDRRTMPSAVRSIVERWLLQRASCPVRYTWDDMGLLFWPRWVKHGHCDTETPCSWPPGMHCAAAESDTLRLLVWQCRRPDSHNRKVRHAANNNGRNRGSGGSAGGAGGAATPARAGTGGVTSRPGDPKTRKMQCRWKKVPYPVTSECFCSC